MHDNEFLRNTPKVKKQHILFDIFNWLFPIFSCVVGFWISAQIFARYMNFDVRIVGYPIYIFKNNYRLYHPLMYLLCFLKFAFKPGFGPYFFASLQPGLIGSILAFLSVVFFALLKTYLKKADKLYGTSRWATTKDLKKFGLLQETGVVLGQIENADIKGTIGAKGSIQLKTIKNGQLICHSGMTNTLLLAPTRSGKGVSVIIPTLLNYPGSVIVFDPKGENWNITAGFRQKFSHILKYSPISRETLKFNPMDGIRKGDFAYADANQIADILYSSDKKGDQTAEFFNNAAKDFITGVILHVKFSNRYKEKNLATVLRVISISANEAAENDDGTEQNALAQEMIADEHGSEQMNSLIGACASRLAKNPKERASVLSTIFSKLQLFEDPLIANSTSISDFDIEDFINSPTPLSLYLTVPFAHIDRVSLVFRLLINFMLRKFSEGETQFGEVKLKNHLIFLIDEFPVLGYFPFIAKVMGILAGYGVTFIIVCQGINQIVDLYGQNHPFLDHCKNVVVFAPGKNEDAKIFTDAIGKESVIHDSVSNSGRKFNISLDNLNISTQEVARDLINPDELMKLPPNQCLIMNQGMPAYIGKKVCYYDDERFRDKVNLPVPMLRKDLLTECQGLPSNKDIDLKKKDEQIIKNRDMEQKIKAMEAERKEKNEFFEPYPEDVECHFAHSPDPDLKIYIQRIKELQMGDSQINNDEYITDNDEVLKGEQVF